MVQDGHAACELETYTTKAKITKKYALIALAALAAVFLLAQLGLPSARAPQAMMKLPQQEGAALESLRSYLCLSVGQARQLQDLSRLNRAETKATSEKIQSHQAVVHEMVNSSAQADEAQFDRLVEELSSLRAQLESSRQELAGKAMAILTPEQQQKLAALLSTVETERQASPEAMPEAWPLIYAASQLGLIAPPAHGERLGESNEPGFRSASGTIAASLN
jgi:Spy/CpxP family protein refolding chaperone